MKATIKHLNYSYSLRTNRWEVTCSCGHVFTPRTTAFSKDLVTCEKCGKQYRIDYNAEPEATIEEK